MAHHRMQLGFSVPDESDLDLVRFDRGCLMLGISLRTAYSRLNDEACDMPRPFVIGGGRQRFFRRSDLVAYVARLAEEAQVKSSLSKNAVESEFGPPAEVKPASCESDTHDAGRENVAA